MSAARLLSRLAAIALLLGLIAAGYGTLVVLPERLNAEADEALDATRDRMQRFQRIAASRPALEAQLAGLRNDLETARLFLEGATDALVAADLQRQISQAVERSGASVSSLRILPARTDNGIQEVPVRVQFKGPIESVQQALYIFGEASPVLTIDNVSIRSRVRTRRSGEAPQVDPDFVVRFDLTGYRQGAAP